MAEKHQITEWRLRDIPNRTVVLTSVAGVIIGGPLVGLMGFSLLATMTLLLVSTPLFILFSPVLFGAACVLALAMLGFVTAAAMAVAGVSMVARVFRPVGWYGAGPDTRIESARDDAKPGQGKDWAGILYHKVQTNPPEDLITNRA